MPRLPDPVNGLYRPHAWVLPYILDWGPCGSRVAHARLYATVLRWFDGAARVRALGHGLGWVPEDDRITSAQHLQNLDDLMDTEAEIGPWLAPGPFCLWLLDLAHGDLIAGGPVTDRVDAAIVDVLPGFGWALDRWRLRFDSVPFPWPFWIWPRPST